MSEIVSLRELPALVSLTLQGNPIAISNGAAFLALLPRLRYLDYKLVTPSQVINFRLALA
jgi:hypothetical protein